jgi:hypothetical protein
MGCLDLRLRRPPGLYERFFFGDPVRMAGALVTGHGTQIQEYAEKVRAFVKEGKDEAFNAAS